MVFKPENYERQKAAIRPSDPSELDDRFSFLIERESLDEIAAETGKDPESFYIASEHSGPCTGSALTATMTSQEIRKKFLDFFAAPAHGRQRRGAFFFALIPDDPSVLLTTASACSSSKPYYAELDPLDHGAPLRSVRLLARHAASCQKSFRTSDIGQVMGDASHTHTVLRDARQFFLWRLLFQKEAIPWAHELPSPRTWVWKFLHVTVFKGCAGDRRAEKGR